MTTIVSEIPFNEKLKSIPGFFGIRLEEEPKYYVLLKDEQKQIRKYSAIIIAQTFVRGDYKAASSEGFFRLANYIFGMNATAEKIAMTAPVFQGRSRKLVMASPVLHEQKTDGWMMSFILPSKYKFENIPRPLVSNIEIIKVPSLVVASIRYSGTNTEEKITQKSKELLDWVNFQRRYEVISEPRSAQYDAPSVLPFFRRNEVQMTVREVASK